MAPRHPSNTETASRHSYDAEWGPEICDQKHKPLMWLSGTTLVIMGITMSMVGYSINSQFAMAEKVLAKAETTQIAVAVEQAKGVEFKIGLKSQLDNIQTWMTTQSRRQEDMNNMLQRLMNDNEHSRQMPAEVKARN